MQCLLGAGAQLGKTGLQSVKPRQQSLQLVRLQILGPHLDNGGLQAVGHLAQAHRAGQPRAPLERVRHAQDFAACPEVVRTRGPLPQGPAELRQQLQRLFFKNREQINIKRVAHTNQVGYKLGGRAADFRRGIDARQNRLVERRDFSALDGFFLQLGGQVGIKRQLAVLRLLLALGPRRKLGGQNGVKRVQQGVVRRFQEAGGKLMQEAANILGRRNEHLGVLGRSLSMKLHMFQGLLEGPGHPGQ